ncbi:MAG: hypothetical protein K5663_10875 [Clostridiales bacterium]|nr:hypothetical protein [Clostridiales bacterium]
MRILRFMVKLVLLPVAIIFWAIKWVMTFAVTMSRWIFDLLAGIIFMLGLACILFAVAKWGEIVPLWCASFFIFLIPHIGDWITGVCAGISEGLGDFIRN